MHQQHEGLTGDWRRGGLCLLLVLLLAACQPGGEAASDRPNILFIAVDDLRPEFGAYGASQVQAPNMDALASQSLIFDRAYCNVPVCGSSRASLLAGMRPGWQRFPGAYDTYLSEDAPEITSLPKHFRDHGYRTHSLGKTYHHADDDSLAWDEVWRPSPRNHSGWRDYQTEENLTLHVSATSRGLPYEKADVADTAYFDGLIASQAISRLDDFSTKDEPFFLAVGFMKPHLPFNAPARYWDLYDSTTISLPISYERPESIPDRAYHRFGELRHYAGIPDAGPVPFAMAKKLIHGYYASVSYADAQIGRVLQHLETLGLAENTVVILWGDHGWNLGEHQLWCKHCNFETSLHTPLLLRVPGESRGQRTRSIVEFIDIYPTLTELAGLPSPAHLQGESLVRILRNEPREKNYAIAKYWSGMTLIKDDWFYTEWIDENGSVEERMLFDHTSDGMELENLSEATHTQDTIRALSEFLHNHWGEDFFDEVP